MGWLVKETRPPGSDISLVFPELYSRTFSRDQSDFVLIILALNCLVSYITVLCLKTGCSHR